MSKKEVTGYSILQAGSMEESKLLLSAHPNLALMGGCDIEVYECVEM